MSIVGERVLRVFCRDPASGDYPGVQEAEVSGHELRSLVLRIPDFADRVANRRVVDFGCGTGRHAIAMARELGCRVCGIDTNPGVLSTARDLARESGLPNDAIWFVDRPDPEWEGTFDVVISHNAMEHFPDPAAVLAQMTRLVRPGGEIIIQFGPPWLSPWGSHMRFFCRLPWLNIWFSEETVMKVRGSYRDDGATRYEEVASGLNRMTVSQFESLLESSNLEVERLNMYCIKGLDFLGRIPVAREFFVNQISCLARRPS